MAFSTCFLPQQIERIRKAFKDAGETFRPRDYMNLDGDAMTEKLKPILGDDAEAFSKMLQEKELLKNRNRALDNVRDKYNQTGKYSPSRVKIANDELSLLKQKNMERVLSPKEFQSYLSSVAAKLTGGEPTREQSSTIWDMGDKINKLKAEAQKGEDQSGSSIELDNANRELRQYINSLNETSQFKAATTLLANGFRDFLISPATGIKNFAFSSMNSMLEGVSTRITESFAQRKLYFKGDVSLDRLVKAGVNNAKFFFDTFHGDSLSGTNNFLKVGEDDAQTPFGKTKSGFAENFGNEMNIKEGLLKKPLDIAQKGVQTAKGLAIGVFHQLPMLINSCITFPDHLDRWSTVLARSDYGKGLNLSANEIFDDALKNNPQTEAGQIARTLAQEKVFRNLSINNRQLADLGLKAQQSMNKWIPNANIGKFALPMVTVPANVLQNSLENAGGGFVSGGIEFGTGLKDLKELKDKGKADTVDGVNAVTKIRTGADTLIRTAGTVVAALYVVANIKKKDYRAPDQYGNSYIKIGPYWLNTAAFGPLDAAVSGFLEAKYGKSNHMSVNYLESIGHTLQKAPISGITSDVKDLPGFFTGIAKDIYDPIAAQNVQKAIHEKSANPIFFGSLIRTQAQLDQEDRDNQRKSVLQGNQNKRNARKPKTF